MMKDLSFLLCFCLFVQVGFSGNTKIPDQPKQVIACNKDSLMLDHILSHFPGKRDRPTGELVAAIGKTFRETPYVAHTLENGKEEKLVVNLRQLDCTTFAENCLALALTIKSGKDNVEQFTHELERVRYREGKREGYTSRLHYFSDWIFDNNRKGLISQPATGFGSPLDVQVSFMSAHPDSYPVLKENPALVPVMVRQEKIISSRKYFFLKKEDVEANEARLQEGDIVGITTSVPGLDITHVGILVRENGRIHLMHASSAQGKVVISKEPLSDLLAGKKSYTGIMIARPQ